jgi:type II secretory pathway pseudopilin PulG
MNKSVEQQDRAASERDTETSQRGVGILEMVIVMGILAIIFALALLGITRSQTALRQSGAAQQFAIYIEKARADSVRRHADVGDESKLRITGTTTYTVTLDFNYDGVTETRTVTLPPGVTFGYNAASPPAAIVFDWRGRVADLSGVRPLLGTSQQSLALNVSSLGDIAVNGNFITPTVATATTISSDINATAAFTPTPTPTP